MNSTEIPDVIRTILHRRGITSDTQILNFLFPKLDQLPLPDAMMSLTNAGELIVEAIKHQKKIVIWGDYDVDGITATALLVRFFRAYKIEVAFHIPNRFDEGYGLNQKWFTKEKFAEFGSDFLLITVDCGISNYSEVSWLQQQGVTVIVTDHHSIPDLPLPECVIVNPSMENCAFHNEKLCGVGIAFYLAATVRNLVSNCDELHGLAKAINLKPFLAFVALGTLADMVELTQTNRILVRAGMEVLVECPPSGLLELLRASDLSEPPLTSEDIGFLLCPKINSAGRLGDSEASIHLLVEEDAGKAAKHAKRLSFLNEERKRITKDCVEYALSIVSQAAVYESKIAIVAGDIHIGVAGLVASKLVEKFGVPAIVLGPSRNSENKGILVGSARSIAAVHIARAIERCNKWVLKSGGHAMAAGLSLREENLKGFVKDISSEISEIYNHDAVLTHINDIEYPVDSLLSDSIISKYKLLEPFGIGNETPIFIDRSARIVEARRVGGNGEHLQVTIRGKFSNLKGIGFNLGEKCSDVQRNPLRTIRYSPTVNRFRRTTSWQVRLIDIL